MAKSKGEFVEFGDVDPAVEALISQKKPKSGPQRGKPGSAGRVGQDQTGRQRATYDVTIPRQNMIREIAKAEQTGQGDIIEAAIVAFYNAWQAGKVELEPYKSVHASLKSPFKTIVPDEFDLFSD
jgi:hypothetical protein